MESFDARKWFKKQYLEEGMSPEEYAKAKEAERLENHPEKDKIKAIQALLDREKSDQSKSSSLIGRMGDRSLKEDDLDEIRYPQDDFTQSQLVPRMEMAVEEQGEKENYKRFIDSLDDLLDVWYMKGFEKDDVLAFMKVIIPSN